MAQKLSSPPTHLSLILIVALLTLELGCQANDTKRRLRWAKAEAALKSPDVRTITDLYARLSELNTSEARRRYFSDPSSLTDFVPMEDYIQGICSREPNQTPATAREAISKKLVWKKVGLTLEQAKRNYLLNFSRNSTAEEIATWDRPVSVYIFTDGDGVILGWEASE